MKNVIYLRYVLRFKTFLVMKRFTVLILVFCAMCGGFFCNAAVAQTDSTTTVQLTKEQKREFKAYTDSVRFNKLIGAINDRHFLMQVDGVYFGGGPTVWTEHSHQFHFAPERRGDCANGIQQWFIGLERHGWIHLLWSCGRYRCGD